MTKHEYNLYDDESAAINNCLWMKFKVTKRRERQSNFIKNKKALPFPELKNIKTF